MRKEDVVDEIVSGDLRESHTFRVELEDAGVPHILFSSLMPDRWPEDPRDWDFFGQFYSFATNHTNCLDVQCDSWGELQEKLSYRFDEFLLLGYFEHGRGVWHLSGETPRGTEADYRWDGRDPAGVFVPSEEQLTFVKDTPGKGYEEELKCLARGDLEVWNMYWNGDVRCTRFVVYRLLHNRDGEPKTRSQSYCEEEPAFEGGVAGLYTDEDVRRVLREDLEALEDKYQVKDYSRFPNSASQLERIRNESK